MVSTGMGGMPPPGGPPGAAGPGSPPQATANTANEQKANARAGPNAAVRRADFKFMVWEILET